MPDTADVVVITGASAGIGAELARVLGAEGKRLVLAARRLPELRTVAREAEARGSPRALVVETDASRRDDIERLCNAALAEFGHFDVWVNNAGRGIVRTVLELSDDDVDQMITVNLKSALYGMQVAVPHFMERGTGHIINVSSALSRVPIATFRSAYSAAKAALNSLTANLRMDLLATHPGIHVTLVMPSVVTTDFARNVIGEPRPPMTGRPGSWPASQTPEEVAEAIAAVIRNPVAEVYTNPGTPELVRRYFADPGAFQDEASRGRSAAR